MPQSDLGRQRTLDSDGKDLVEVVYHLDRERRERADQAGSVSGRH